MSPGATFERVYLALKQQLMDGGLPPGVHLEPAALSGDLNASITPVRDALHRLVGERLVQAPRNNGFSVPIYTEASLRDLYGWNLRLLHLALAVKRRSEVHETPAASSKAAAERVDETERLFLAIARLPGSGEHLAAVAGLNDRLRPVRHKETMIHDPGAELSAIADAMSSGERPILRRLLAAYHRRRIAKVPLLLEQLQPSF